MKKTNVQSIKDLLQEPEVVAAFESFVPNALQQMAKQNLVKYCQKSRCEMAELPPDQLKRYCGVPEDQWSSWCGSREFMVWLYDGRSLEELFANQAERAMRRLAGIAHGPASQGQLAALKAILDFSAPKPKAKESAVQGSEGEGVESLSDDELELEIARIAEALSKS